MLGPILITGAEGFVGSALTAHLAKAFPHNHIIGSTRAHEFLSGSLARKVKLDLGCDDVLGALSSIKPSLIFHLAARSSVAEGVEGGWQTFSDNVGSTLALARAIRVSSPGVPVVFASSGEVYGTSFNSGAPVSECTAPFPHNAYGRSKLAGEFALSDILGAICPVIILRLFNHFGRGQDERFVIPSFAAQLRRMKEPGAKGRLSVGNLDAIRDFLPVTDILDAYVAAAEIGRNSRPGAIVYNIASGTGRSIRSVLDDLLRVAGLDVEVAIDSARLRPSEINKAVGNADKFRTATGWKPKADWNMAISAML
jgi:GDP-4-dehydro-6-deoxy-D-mannose reductase